MDQELLVDVQIEDGRAFIAELVRANIDVDVAFWVKTTGSESWSLYLGSNALNSMPAGESFLVVYDALSRTHPMSMSYSDVKHASPSNQVAVDAIKIRDRYPANLPIRLRAKQLGDLSIEEAYIYPRTTGLMSRDEVVQTVAALMSRTGAFAPSSITLRDGSSLQAVPTGIQLGVPGELRIVLHDLVGNTDRTISADEVVSIH